MSRSLEQPLPDMRLIDRRSLGEFELIARIALEDAGLHISRDQAPMLFARVSKRLRALGIDCRTEYCDLIASPLGLDERRQLIAALTTNVTSFFREAHHFETLARAVTPELAERARSGGRIRFWSAGCSTGPEPYSIAMTVLEALPEAAELDVKILATDINRDVLRLARDGLFGAAELAPVSSSRRQRFFELLAGDSADEDLYRIRPPVAGLIAFRELNLHAPWPMKNKFDAIFCRNVMIYFDRQTRSTLWARFQNALLPGGYLFIGHSERLDRANAQEFRSVGTTTYQRIPTN